MSAATLHPSFQHTNYVIQRKLLKLIGGAFYVYDPSEQVAFYSELKGFKLKDDITVFTSEDMKTSVLTIKSRNILDIAATFDVHDIAQNEKVGAIKKKGLKSLLRDEWSILNASDQEVGTIKEDSLLAMARRFLEKLIPQQLTGEMGGKTICTFKQGWNPFVSKVNLDFSMDSANLFDRRLGIAAAILICLQESKGG